MNNVFDYCFGEADLSTIGGMEIEQLNFLGEVATIRRAFTSKDVDLLSHFDNNDETQNGINNTSLKQLFLTNILRLIEEKLKVNFPVNIYLGFVKHLKRLLKT